MTIHDHNASVRPSLDSWLLAGGLIQPPAREEPEPEPAADDEELSEPLLNLLMLADAAQEGRPAPPEVGQWLAESLEAYTALGLSLERALGIVGEPSRRKAGTVWRQLERDKYLREAWAECEGTPYQKSRELAKAIAKFDVTWERWRAQGLTEPPEEAPKLKKLLFEARRRGGELPISIRRIHDIATATSS